ncbi:hypothetical protein Rsub_10675 [Raphidocelis subcapitata]|uniref:Dynein regulatory complex subunit 2 n=1 Tax=Raphidocelis subcapitata TaxID=307507 RepID=A0A2V0PM91_9CHLO|nr:hypothetical protein Rsub_10675 [Raphidocelis subcapitata]|eukprot:GBF98175.1 hypothetical protein Rsub_10675 [Raphidocelis subcapitata]
MAPKKKAGGGKGGKAETAEERAARLEMESLANEERQRRDAEIARVALRQRQEREQRYAHINGIKIHNQWRKIMRLAKVEELRREIEVLSQNHEREVDRKDAMVQMLDHDLEEAEEQYQQAARAHLVIIDQLLDLQHARVAALERQFNESLRSLQEEFERERAAIAASHARQRKEMADVASAMSAGFAEAEGEARQEFESAREEIKNHNSEEYNILKIQLEGIIEELEGHFEAAHRAYLDSTEHRSKAFRALQASDAQAARVIEQRTRRLAKLGEDIHRWRAKISSSGREWAERNGALRREKELMAKHYAQLKATLNAARQQHADRLKSLSFASAAATADLDRKLARARSVLRLAEVCRRLETEEEKVLPFWSLDEAVAVDVRGGAVDEALAAAGEAAAAEAAAADGGEEAFEGGSGWRVAEGGGGPGASKRSSHRSGAGGSSLGGSLAVGGGGRTSSSGAGGGGRARLVATALREDGGEVGEQEHLSRFFRRFNKALLDKAATDAERARLTKENEDLRQLLKSVLDGISVNEAVMGDPANPLLVVNQRLQLTMAERRKAAAAGGGGGGSGGGGSPVAGAARGGGQAVAASAGPLACRKIPG